MSACFLIKTGHPLFFDKNCSPKPLNLTPVKYDLSSLLCLFRDMMVTLCYNSPSMVKYKSVSKGFSYKTFLMAFIYQDN